MYLGDYNDVMTCTYVMIVYVRKNAHDSAPRDELTSLRNIVILRDDRQSKKRNDVILWRVSLTPSKIDLKRFLFWLRELKTVKREELR